MNENKEPFNPKYILSRFGDYLIELEEKKEGGEPSSLHDLYPETSLPFPVNTVRRAIAVFLLDNNYIGEKRVVIEKVYIELSKYIPEEEYNLIASLERDGRVSDGTIGGGWQLAEKVKEIGRRVDERRGFALEELRSLRRISGIEDDLEGLIPKDNPSFESTDAFIAHS